MFASFLTTIFFSLSVIFAARSSRVLGGSVANLGRICIAALLLAIWAHGFGAGVQGPALPWFFFSGVIGFGLGDMALFGALTRIGPRLSILLTQCLAAPIAAVVEFAWLGIAVHPVELFCATLILGGVALALAPDHGWEGDRRIFWIGVLFGIGSALGQSLGAVVSRKAYLVAAAADFPIDGGSAAYQRILGGVLMTWIGFFLLRRAQRPAAESTPVEPLTVRLKRGWPFVLANALSGPVFGVGCYQWALKETPSGIVLPIVAASPLVTMILSYFIEGLRPQRRAVIGGVLAVVGAVALARVRT